MKKKYIVFIIFVLFLFIGIVLYVINKNEFYIGKESNIEIVDKWISLSIKENTLKNTGATLVLKNDSDVDVIYGNPYEIEIKKDGKWHKIQVMIDFTLPAYYLKSKETKEIELNWENGYGKLPKGDYRIIKSIDIEKEEEIFETFYISAEFTIKWWDDLSKIHI